MTKASGNHITIFKVVNQTLSLSGGFLCFDFENTDWFERFLISKNKRLCIQASFTSRLSSRAATGVKYVTAYVNVYICK